MPIYYVIARVIQFPEKSWRSYLQILAVYETTDDKIDSIFNREGYGHMQVPIQTFMFVREPKPLFKEWFRYHLEGENYD